MILFIGLTITTAIIIVYLTGSKRASKLFFFISSLEKYSLSFIVQTCQLNFKRTDRNPVEYKSDPQSVAIGDFNNDTFLDLVVVNRAVNNISIFLAGNNRTFAKQTTYSTGRYSSPNVVVVADLNNDQRLDIIVACFGINRVGIFLGLGDGSFVDNTTISTGSARPIWIHIAHLDNDTFLDLITADYGTESITIFSGDGTGYFSFRMRYSTGFDSFPVSVVSADVNNDSHLDLAIVNFGTNNIMILFGQSNGEFFDEKILPTGINSHPNSIALGYFNNDLLLDIAIANYGSKSIRVFLNSNGGIFTDHRTYEIDGASPHFITVGDIDKDDQSDLIITNRGRNNIGVLIGHGNGSFARPQMYSTGSNSSISTVAIDLNRDALLDIIVVNNDTNSVSVFFGKEEIFHSPVTYSTITDFYSSTSSADVTNMDDYSTRTRTRRQITEGRCVDVFGYIESLRYSYLAAGDLNNDNQLDIVAGTFGKQDVGIFYGYRNGSFQYQSSYFVDFGLESMLVADWNNDSFLDIIMSGLQTDSYRVYFGHGNGTFTEKSIHSVESQFTPTAVADLNHDTRLDIVGGSLFKNHITILLGGDNNTFTDSLSYSIDSTLEALAIADLNNDDHLDIVIVPNNKYALVVFLGYGNGSLRYRRKYQTPFVPVQLATGDFNNDQQLDIVVISGSTDKNIGVLLGYGNGSFAYPILYSSGYRLAYVSVADFNRDGQLDIVVSAYMDGRIQIVFGFGNGSFVNHQTYFSSGYQQIAEMGGPPGQVVVTDVNGDSRLDIIVSNWDARYISVFLLSPMEFSSDAAVIVTSTNGSRLNRILLDDFNHDHNIDIVLLNYGTKNVGILLGHGDGSFQEQMTFSLDSTSNPQSMTVGDFNRDNQLDLAVANAGTNKIDMLLGDGLGMFIRQRTYDYRLNDTPSVIFADDFNHDQQSEILIAYDNRDNIDIIVAYDSGNLTDPIHYPTHKEPRAIVVADFNNDTILDILIVNNFEESMGILDVRSVNEVDQSLSILYGHGNGKFTNEVIYRIPHYAYLVAVADFNNDTLPDIVLDNIDNIGISVLLNYGNGSVANPITYPVDGIPSALVIGDFNNDSLSDLVVFTSNTNLINTFLSYGNGSFRQITQLVSPNLDVVATVDFNHDHRLDIVVTHHWSREYLAVLFGDGEGSFVNETSLVTDSVGWPISVNDMNNDGHLDIIMSSYEGILDIHLGDGNGTFVRTTRYVISCSPQYISVGDMNNDKQLDIVVVSYDNRSINVLLGYGDGSFTRPATYPTGRFPTMSIFADLNNDTQMDIVVANSGEPSISLLLGNFNRVFNYQMTLITGAESHPQSFATGDFNNDTHRDIAVANLGTNNVGIFLGHGNGSFSTQTIYPTISSPSVIAVADLNNDTHLDLVVLSSNHSSFAAHLGDGHGSFIHHTTDSTGVRAQPKSLSIADFDNDHIPDIIVTNSEVSNVVVFLGHGDGTFAHGEEFWIGSETHPFAVAVADFDKNKKLDFAVANYDNDNLEIYLQTC